MKKVLAALVCTVGAVACGESRPAEDPSTTTTASVKTETTSYPAPHAQPSVDVRAVEPRPAPIVGSSTAPASDDPGVANGTKDADNTKINDRDRHGAVVPTDQGGGNDRDITAAIRRAVVGDKALSFSAKNVKIITVDGKVTLRGSVKSESEKSAVEAKAKATTGVSVVDNQLEVTK